MYRQSIFFAAGVITTLTVITLHRAIFTEEQRKFGAKKKKAVFFGDSITQHGSNPTVSGWVSLFVDWWVRRVDVINRGFSGYNSKWALAIVDEVVVLEKPDLVFLFFGANDAVDERVVQHVSLPQYRVNMESIVVTIKKKLPATKLIIITPPPVWEPALERANIAKGKAVALDRTNEKTLTYVNACKDLGKKFKFPVVDAWTALGGSTANRADYLPDGLHLNEL